MPPKLPDKRKVFEALVAEAPSVFVHLDPRRDNVRVPAHFRNNPMLVLEIGMNMRVPIPDLDIDERGVNCTLSFGGRPFWCSIPWTSVFTIVASDKRGMAWPSDVPPEVAQAMKTQAEPPKPAQKRPELVAIDGSSGKTQPPKPGEPSVAPVCQIRPSQTPMPDTDGNAAGVLEPPDSDDQTQPPTEPAQAEGKQTAGKPAGKQTSGQKTKRKLPPYLRVVQ